MPDASGSGSWPRGYVQVYTGNGKGKTTAALGLALRAAGAGLKVLFVQFLKAGRYSEIAALERFADRITVKQYGRGCFVVGKPTQEDILAARQGLREARDLMASGDFRVVVLDEANVAVHHGLFTADDLSELIDAKPKHVELVITGRAAHDEILARADLVTEMHAVKHYHDQGIEARDGIEK